VTVYFQPSLMVKMISGWQTRLKMLYFHHVLHLRIATTAKMVHCSTSRCHCSTIVSC